MISPAELIKKFRYALDTDWGYIWGTSGQVWTQAKQNAATRETTVKYGSKWIGHCVADCSGLFVWAFSKLGASIYHGSNTIWNKYCSAQGKLVDGKRSDGKEIQPGTAVFLLKDGVRHHIGLYVGDDTCIEAKGTQYGVVTSKLNHWHEWGELRGVAYENGKVEYPTLRKGNKGEDVKFLQERLNELGYGVAIDGIFGTETFAAVRTFQAKEGLSVDGIVGPKTWTALGVYENQEQTEKPVVEGDHYYVMPMEQYNELCALVNKAVEILNMYNR